MRLITKQDLPVSDVRFIDSEGRHEYRLGFDLLVGVTSVLSATLFEHKYDGIDKDVLDKAARRGTAIHEAIQQYEMDGVFTPFNVDAGYMDDAETALAVWQKIRKKKIFHTVDVEYLVTNNVDIASKIDMVLQAPDGRIILADIKTTSKLDKEYLSWQLSFYKYFFEEQTGLSVSNLVGLWYDRSKEKWSFVEIPAKSLEDINKITDLYRKGLQLQRTSDTLPAPMFDIGQMYADMELAVKEATARRDEFRSRMLEEMKKAGLTQFKTDNFTVTYCPARQTTSYDITAFRELHPEMDAEWDKCEKVTNYKESVRITIKSKE